MRKPIAAAFSAYKQAVVPADASQAQVTVCEMAFMAGAASLYSYIMGGLTPGPDPQTDDAQLLLDIAVELHDFGKKLDKQQGLSN